MELDRSQDALGTHRESAQVGIALDNSPA